MPTWEARVARGTNPADRVDAELRYALAAPLLEDAALWVDLGAGTGVAAAAALGELAPGLRAVLVDRDAEALDEARREVRGAAVETVEADLETADGTAAVEAAIAETGVDGPRVVTAFDVLHQLADFTALVDLLLTLGKDGTVLVSVPDDGAGAVEDPERRSAWSASAAEELRRLLPPGALAWSQVPVRATAIVPAAGGETAPLGTLKVQPGAAAAHHLLVFGRGAERLAPVALARPADLDAETADARRRESDLAYLEARLAQLEAAAAD